MVAPFGTHSFPPSGPPSVDQSLMFVPHLRPELALQLGPTRGLLPRLRPCAFDDPMECGETAEPPDASSDASAPSAPSASARARPAALRGWSGGESGADSRDLPMSLDDSMDPKRTGVRRCIHPGRMNGGGMNEAAGRAVFVLFWDVEWHLLCTSCENLVR